MENNQINNYIGKKGVHIPQDVKDYILKKIKKVAKSVPEISKEHGISKSAIYKMLKDETSGTVVLQKENSLLKQLVAELSLKIRENEKGGGKCHGEQIKSFGIFEYCQIHFLLQIPTRSKG